MASIDLQGISAEELSRRFAALRALVGHYHNDPAYRRRVEADPVAAFAEKGIDLPANIEIRVVANTDDRLYVAFPADPSLALNDEAFAAVAGGNTTGSVGTAGTVSSLSCPLDTLGSASTTSTVGSI